MRILAKWLFGILICTVWGLLVTAIVGYENPYRWVLYWPGAWSLCMNGCQMIDKIK